MSQSGSEVDATRLTVLPTHIFPWRTDELTDRDYLTLSVDKSLFLMKTTDNETIDARKLDAEGMDRVLFIEKQPNYK
jgi:hypothetical protein